VVEKVVGKESELLARVLVGNKWTVEKPEHCTLGKWIELGRKLRGAPDGEILSLIGSVETYLEDKLDDETFPSSANYREYFRGYAETILKAAQAELRKRKLKGLG
jgi:hypothetical protein